MSTKFTENRNLFHTFSRVAIQEGQGVAAAVNKTGHTVTIKDVWADIDRLPKNTTYFGNANTAYDDLKTVYNANSEEFSQYVTLYENVELSPVDGSGQDADKNQAWELKVNGQRVKNFVSPTDVADANGQPCNGYTLKLFDKNGTQIAATDGNWAFDYVAGLVIFERGKTPQDMGWAGTTAGSYIKMSAWAYAGDYLDSTLTSQNTRLGVVEAQLGLGDSAEGDSVAQKISSISGVIDGLAINGSNAIEVTSNGSLLDTPVISLKVDGASNAIEVTENGLKSALSLVKSTSDNVTTIKLMANGVELNSINLDIDKVVTSGAYIPSSEQLKLSFTSGNDVYIPVSALVDEYSAGSGIAISDVVDGTNVISVKADANSEDFFYVDPVNGVGVSGIQTAIDLAAGAVISGVASIPVDATGFQYNTLVYTEDGETAIVDVATGTVVDISEESVDKITSSTISSAITRVSAVTGYVEESISGILPDAQEYVDENFLSGIVAGNGIEVSSKVNKEQTISILPDPAAGNLVKVTSAGIYVSASEYVLPVADGNKLGGILEGNDLSIDQTGLVTVLSANQVKHDLKFGGKTFNGSAEQEILASDLGALTGVTVGNKGISIIDGAELEKVVSLNVKSDDEYLYISESGLATSGITEAITNYVDPRVTFISGVLSGYTSASAVKDADMLLAEAIGAEADQREEETLFLSSVLSGYTEVSAVIAADNALDSRLKDVEDELGISEGGNEGSVKERLAEIETTISAYTSTNTISGAIKSEESARTNADSYISGIVDTISGDLDVAEEKIVTISGFAHSLRIERSVGEAGFAARYRLTTGNGDAIGAIIDIPRDQFLSGATFNSTTNELELTFALSGIDSQGFPTISGQTVGIPVGSLVDVYTAGSGITLDDHEFSLVKDSNEDSKYLVIGENTIGLSGISDAIDAIGTQVTDNINPAIEYISGQVSGLQADDQTSGSVLYAVRTKAQFADYDANGSAASGTIQYAIRKNTADIATLNADKTVEGSVDYKIDQYDQTISGLIAQISTLNSNIENGIVG